jgi:hypothetical protein
MIIQDFETSLISETRSMNRTAMKEKNFIAVGFNRRGENAMKEKHIRSQNADTGHTR